MVDTSPLRGAPGSGYRVRSEETWAEAKAAYLGGMSAEAVCARFDLGVRTLRMRAKAEGWRRVDQPDPPPAAAFDAEALEALDEDPMLDAADLAALAWRRARRAVMQGALREALGWRRVHRDYLALAIADARADALESAEGPPRDHMGALAQVERDVDMGARYTRFGYAEAVRDWLAGAEEDPDESGPGGSVEESLEPAPDSAPSAPLHGLHTLHADFPPTAATPSSNPTQARIRARVEAWKARQAARAA